MKYVIIQDSDGIEFPVFCVAPVTHAQLATAFRRDDSRKVISAGYVEFLATGAAVTFGRSDTLDLAPRPGRDAALITAMTMATVSLGREADFREVRPCGVRMHVETLSPEMRQRIADEVAALHPRAAAV